MAAGRTARASSPVGSPAAVATGSVAGSAIEPPGAAQAASDDAPSVYTSERKIIMITSVWVTGVTAGAATPAHHARNDSANAWPHAD